MAPTPRLRRLGVLTTVFTFLLVTVGGMVRGTGSGEGCPDWPRCHGRLVPPLQYHAIIEYSHRLSAFVVICLTAALAIAALRARRRLPRGVFALAVTPFPLVLSQALLGAVVVRYDLRASSVVAHLLVAMALFAILLSLVMDTTAYGPAPGSAGPAVSAGKPSGADVAFARVATAVAAGTLALMLLGSYVSGRGAGLAFTTWPFFGGHLIPVVHSTGADLDFAHRLVAAFVAAGVFALAAIARRRPQAPAVGRLVRAAAALIGVEIVLGAGNVWTRLSPVTRTAHLATAALLWAITFSAARLAWRLPSPAPDERLARPGPSTALVDAR